MSSIELTFHVRLDEDDLRSAVNVICRALEVDRLQAEGAEPRHRASRTALVAGQKPRNDRGLLIDVNEVAKLLKVSPRHVYRMADAAVIPKALRIGLPSGDFLRSILRRPRMEQVHLPRI